MDHPFEQLRTDFLAALQLKTGWGRNDVQQVFDDCLRRTLMQQVMAPAPATVLAPTDTTLVARYSQFVVCGGRPDGDTTNWKYVGPSVIAPEDLIKELEKVRSYPCIEIDQLVQLDDGREIRLRFPQ